MEIFMGHAQKKHALLLLTFLRVKKLTQPQLIAKENEKYSLPCISESVSHSVMSESLQPHGLQPGWFFCSWDSAGMNTGGGSHSLLQRIFPTQGSNLGIPYCKQILYHLSHQGSPIQSMCVLCSVTLVTSDSLSPHGLQPTQLFCPWDSPGRNTRVGCHSFLQEIFSTQGLNPRLLCLCMAGRFFTH